MDADYFCNFTDDLFDFAAEAADAAGDYYCDSVGLGSPGSSGSDIENHLIYDHNTNNLLPSSPLYDPPHHPYLRAQGSGGAVGKPGKKVFQRTAANMRERRRMKSINDAFETLRTCIPNEVQADRRLSKVDTLKVAMRYIRFLSDMVQSCGDCSSPGGGGSGGGGVGQRGKGQRLQEKIIVRCRLAEEEGMFHDEGIVLGHSLSWDDPHHRHHHPSSKRVAKIWIPESPTESDLVNLASYCSDC
ncbi:hypothetical protein ACOMHN_054514 [Nucella lapillus]